MFLRRNIMVLSGRLYINDIQIGRIIAPASTALVDIAYFISMYMDSETHVDNAFVCSFNFFEVPWCGTPELAHIEWKCVPRPVNVAVPGDFNNTRYYKYTLESAKNLSKEEYLSTGIIELYELEEIRINILKADGLAKYDYISDPVIFTEMLAKHADEILFDFTPK